MSCGDAEAVPPVAMQKVPLATDDVVALALSTSALTSAPAAKDGHMCASRRALPGSTMLQHHHQ